MHINDLPPEVLTAILRFICQERHYRTRYWINRLRILAVCHRWRHIALPMVYRKISIDYIDNVRTNIDLMTENMVHYPRALNIWVHSKDEDPIPRLRHVLEKIQMNKGLFYGVSSLHLHVDFSALSTDDDDDEGDTENASLETEKLQEITRFMKIFLPNVTTLHCHINIAENAGLVFESALVKQYASQLVKVEVNSLSLTPETTFTSSLSDLSIWWYPDSGALPRVTPNCLTKLELAGIDKSFDWSIFVSKASTDDRVLHFPTLEHMFVDVWYMPEEEEDGDDNDNDESGVPRNKFNYVLDAPRLRVMKVRLCPFTCSLLAAMSAPKVFKILEFFTLTDMRFEFFGFSLSDTAKKMFAGCYERYSSEGTIDDIDFINDLQSNKKLVYQSVSAHIDGPFDGVVQKINWPRVTRLFINIPLSFESVLTLLGSALPNLLSLRVENIVVEEQEDGLFVVSGLCDSSLPSPIECRLKHFEYDFELKNGRLQNLSGELARFMIRSIKSLKSVVFYNSQR